VSTVSFTEFLHRVHAEFVVNGDRLVGGPNARVAGVGNGWYSSLSCNCGVTGTTPVTVFASSL